MGVIYLVRHGKASFGGPDYDVLSDIGRDQGRVAGAEMHRRGVDPVRVLTGSLRRQIDTAEAMMPGRAARADPRWDEYDAEKILARHGDGKEFAAKPSQQELEVALRRWAGDEGPLGWTSWRAGAVEAYRELSGSLGKGESAVVVTSGGVIGGIAADILGLDLDGFLALNRVIANASFTTLTVGRSGTNLMSFNDHAHFEGELRHLLTYR